MRSSPPRGSAMSTVPESSAAGERRFFGRFKPWVDLTRDDVGDSSGDGVMEVDISDITLARQGLDALEESRRTFATTLRMEQRQFVASREFLTRQRLDVTRARDELSQTRAELERRDAELEEWERGLAQREAAIDDSSTTEQLQLQIIDLRAELETLHTSLETEKRLKTAELHASMAAHKEQIRAMGEQIRDLQSSNEGLQEKLADAAVLAGRQREISRKTTLELEKQVQAANSDKCKAQEAERRAADSLVSTQRMLEESRAAWNDARTQSDLCAAALAKATKEHQLNYIELEKVQTWIAKALQKLGLIPLPLQDATMHNLKFFFTDLAGQLKSLPMLLERRAIDEGRQIIDTMARLILPRVRHLAPDFPFDALLDEFATQEEAQTAIDSVEWVIKEVKDAAQRG